MAAIGTVRNVRGDVFAVDKKGLTRRLKEGDALQEGEVLVTGPKSSADLVMVDGRTIPVPEQQTFAVDSSVAGPVNPNAAGSSFTAGSALAQKIIKALASAGDLNKLLEEEATTAGLTGTGGDNDGGSFVMLLSIAEGINNPTVYQFNFNTFNNLTVGREGGKAPTIGVPIALEYGTLTFNVGGVATYKVNDAALVGLGAGDVLTEVLTVNGEDIIIKIIGTNNGPIAINDSNNIGASMASISTTTLAGGVLLNDTDSDTPASSFAVTAVRTGTEAGTGAAGTVGTALVGTFGTLTLNADGSYTYVLNQANAAVKALPVGGTLTDTFTYTMTDGALTDQAELVITINGANDGPVAVADVAAVKEDTGSGGGEGLFVVAASGNLLTNDTDVDTTDTHSVTAVTGGADGGSTATTITRVGTYGTLVVTKATGAYTYTLANGQANVQALAEGQQVTDVFTYTNADNNGATSSSTLTVTVTGTNDAPVAVANVAGVKEDTNTAGQPNPVTGNLLANDTDVDTNDTHSVTAVTGGGSGSSDATTITRVGTYGTLVVTKATGAYTYTLANGQANVQALAEGQTVTDVFTYTNSDGLATNNATLTVTVTGTNDGPVAVADAAAVKEDTNTQAQPNPVTGNLLANDTDIDTNDTHSVTAVTGGTDGGTSATTMWDPLESTCRHASLSIL